MNPPQNEWIQVETYWQKNVGNDTLLVWAPDTKYDPAPIHYEVWIGPLKIKGIFMSVEFYAYELEQAKRECESVHKMIIALLCELFATGKIQRTLTHGSGDVESRAPSTDHLT